MHGNHLIDCDNGLNRFIPFYIGKDEEIETIEPDDHSDVLFCELVECYKLLSKKCVCEQDRINLIEVKRLLNIN